MAFTLISKCFIYTFLFNFLVLSLVLNSLVVSPGKFLNFSVIDVCVGTNQTILK